MPHYSKDFREPQTDAWWDPDAVRNREADAMLTDEDRKKAAHMWLGVAMAPLVLLAEGLRRAEQRRREMRPYQQRPPVQRAQQVPCRSRCPFSSRTFELIDATPHKKVWRCSRCGETFRLMSSDNPVDYHSC